MRRFAMMGLSLAVLTLSAGCSSSSSPSSSPEGGTPGSPGSPDGSVAGADGGSSDPTQLGGSRPVTLHVPPGYKQGVAAPLVILLHGYSASGALQDLYFGLTAVSDARGFLYAHPDGTVDKDGKRFWNATDACCDLYNTGVDDSTYISSIITQAQASFTVDPKRIFVVGHSNGGFMSYRMACDHPDQVAAIASLAGAMYSDVTKCAAKSPVSILEIHGTSDTTIVYGGDQIAGHGYPGAMTTVSDWATLDGCSATADTSAPPLDLESTIAGNESTVTRYASGCKPGGSAELWTITGGTHIPSLSTTFMSSVVDFLYAHPKP